MTPTTDDARPVRDRAGGRWIPLLAIVALAAAACGDDTTGPGVGDDVTLAISMSVEGQFSPASIGTGAPPLADVSGGTPREVRGAVSTSDSAGNSVTVERAVLLIESIRLRPAGVDACGTGECATASEDPIVLSLPLADSLATINPVGQVPPELYDGIHFRLRRAEGPGGGVGSDVPGLGGSSVLVQGTYNGSDFSFTSGAEQTVSLTFPSTMNLTGGETFANVTLEASVDPWFRTEEGVLGDPSSSSADEVLDNVLGSLGAFSDQDIDGSPDGPDDIGG